MPKNTGESTTQSRSLRSFTSSEGAESSSEGAESSSEGAESSSESSESSELEPHLTVVEEERYHRTLLVPTFSVQDQERLKTARVLVVGAGGLGSAALAYLVAVGVGRIGIVEFDRVSLSNLQRQLLYTTADLDRPKLQVALERLQAINPHVHLEAYPFALDDVAAAGLVGAYDLVLDCTDNYEARYVIDRYAAAAVIPLVYGTAQGWSGQVSVFDPGAGKSYRALFGEESPQEPEVGVVSPVVGVIGAMQAVEAVKLIVRQGDSLTGRLLVYDGLLATVQCFML